MPNRTCRRSTPGRPRRHCRTRRVVGLSVIVVAQYAAAVPCDAQNVCPLPHVVLHALEEQASLVAHALPHAAQLLGSNVVLVQLAPHIVRFVGHAEASPPPPLASIALRFPSAAASTWKLASMVVPLSTPGVVDVVALLPPPQPVAVMAAAAIPTTEIRAANAIRSEPSPLAHMPSLFRSRVGLLTIRRPDERPGYGSPTSRGENLLQGAEIRTDRVPR